MLFVVASLSFSCLLPPCFLWKKRSQAAPAAAAIAVVVGATIEPPQPQCTAFELSSLSFSPSRLPLRLAPLKLSSSTTEGGGGRHICYNCVACISRTHPNVPSRPGEETHVFGAIQCGIWVLFLRRVVLAFRVGIHRLLVIVAVVTQASAFCLCRCGITRRSCLLVLLFHRCSYLFFSKTLLRCRHRCQAAIHFVRLDNERRVSVFLSGCFAQAPYVFFVGLFGLFSSFLSFFAVIFAAVLS